MLLRMTATQALTIFDYIEAHNDAIFSDSEKADFAFDYDTSISDEDFEKVTDEVIVTEKQFNYLKSQALVTDDMKLYTAFISEAQEEVTTKTRDEIIALYSDNDDFTETDASVETCSCLSLTHQKTFERRAEHKEDIRQSDLTNALQSMSIADVLIVTYLDEMNCMHAIYTLA